MRLLAAASLAALAGACATVVAPRYYMLTPAVNVAQGAEPRQISIGVGPVALPEYLLRKPLVAQGVGSELLVSDGHLWAEPLDAAFPRVLADNLARRLRTDQVVLHPWRGDVRIDYRVQVEVLRFHAGADRAVRLEARWRAGPDGAGLPSAARSDIRVAARGEGHGALVDAQSEALGLLAEEIATEIESAVARGGATRPGGH